MNASKVHAVEIDPVIMEFGAFYHPERPYDDPRVIRVVDDARSFLRSTTETFDMVVYGLLDSHGLLSHASSVRLEKVIRATALFIYANLGLPHIS